MYACLCLWWFNVCVGTEQTWKHLVYCFMYTFLKISIHMCFIVLGSASNSFYSKYFKINPARIIPWRYELFFNNIFYGPALYLLFFTLSCLLTVTVYNNFSNPSNPAHLSTVLHLSPAMFQHLQSFIWKNVKIFICYLVLHWGKLFPRNSLIYWLLILPRSFSWWFLSCKLDMLIDSLVRRGSQGCLG